MTRRALFFFFWFLWTATAAAHGTIIFETDPTSSRPVSLGTVESVVQTIAPPGDYLGGFDLWIENPGTPGEATFELRSGNDPLSRVTVPIPHVKPPWGGAELHIDLERQIAMPPGSRYTITVINPPRELALHLFDRNQLLQHNSRSYASYADRFVGPLRFGAQEQETNLKIAFRELREETPPRLTLLPEINQSPTETKLSFQANELVDFEMRLTPEGGAPRTTPFTGAYHFCPEETPPCEATLAVIPDTPYAYTIVGRDEWGNEAIAEGTFRSARPVPSASLLPSPPASPMPSGNPPAPGSPPVSPPLPTPPPPPDREPPHMTNPRILELSPRRVRIAWSTNEAADARILIRRGEENAARNTDPAFELEHTLGIEPVLTPNTAYEAILSSYDPAGNAASLTLPFTTPLDILPPAGGPREPTPSGSAPPPPLATLTSPSETLTAETNNGALVVRWNSPVSGEPADGYRVDVLDDSFSLRAQRAVSPGTHETAFGGLAAGSYQVIVYKKTGASFEKLGAPIMVTHAGSAIPRAAHPHPFRRIGFGLGFVLLLGIPSAVIIRKLAK